MTEERLKEIKDSIDFQKKIYEIKGYELGIVQEEIDLYNEVIKLKKFEKYTKEDMEEIIAEEISSYVNENKRLKKELNKHIKEGIEKDQEIDRLCNALNEVIERNSKAIEYIEENSKSYSLPGTIKDMRYVDFYRLLDILQGSDKEC